MALLQEKPICFGCENVIDRQDEIIYAPPFEEEAFRKVSACFHGICLMDWRERRQAIRERLRQRHEAFLRHVKGECGCPTEE